MNALGSQRVAHKELQLGGRCAAAHKDPMSK